MRLGLIAGRRNSVGRTYCLWLICRELGWEAVPILQGPMWAPLQGSSFDQQSAAIADFSDGLPASFDAIVTYQPLPETLGVALRLKPRGTPLVLDVDELAWEQRYGYTIAHRLRVMVAMSVRGRNPVPYQRLKRCASKLPTLISNPSLADYYCGEVVPHVREASPAAPWPTAPGLRVCFVGTPRPHKGIERLRAATASIPNCTLFVTAPPPPDAQGHEVWTGPLPFDRAMEVVASSHVAVAASDDSVWSRHQFPVKLIDAMMAARAVVASDLPSIEWVTGGSAYLVKPGDTGALGAALWEIEGDREAARRRGEAGRREALARFTPAAAAPAFRAAIERAS